MRPSGEGKQAPLAVTPSPTMTPTPAVPTNIHDGHDVDETRVPGAVVEQFPPGRAMGMSPPAVLGTPVLADPTLALLAEILDDLERTRIANENRLRQLTRTADDSDGEQRGFGLTEDHPDVARLAGIVAGLAKLEHDSTLNLQRAMRGHALGPWVKAQVGIGDKQAARLLAAIGDPYFNTLHGRPRTVSELWAYSGLHVVPGGRSSTANQVTPAAGDSDLLTGQLAHGALADPAGEDQACDPGRDASDAQSIRVGVAAKRRKGQKSNWSNAAKMRAHLIAQSCIKQARSPYRATYDARRTHTAVTHPDWTAGHSHNDALRITAKAVLRDLWRESRRLHDEMNGVDQ